MLVKGILHPDDGTLVGIIVSNHGEHQTDSAIALLDALPAIADVVGQVPRFFEIQAQEAMSVRATYLCFYL